MKTTNRSKGFVCALTAALGVSVFGCDTDRGYVEPKSEPPVLRTFALTSTGLTLDPDGYPQPICLSTIGCNQPGQQITFGTIPAGTYTFTDGGSIELDSGSNTLGTLVVNAAGVATLTSSHFDEISDSQIRLRTVTVTVEHNQYPATLIISGVKSGEAPSWPVKLITARRYTLSDGASVSLTGNSNHFSGAGDVRVEANGHLGAGTDTRRHFDVDAVGRRLTARTVPVTINKAGYAGDLAVLSVFRGTTQEWTVPLIRERVYGMSDGSSADLTGTLNHLSPLPWDVRLEPDDTLVAGADTLRHFTQDSAARRLTARTVEVTINHAGYSGNLQVQSVHAGSAPSWPVRLLRERSYILNDGSSADFAGTSNRLADVNWDVKLGTDDRLQIGTSTQRHFTLDATGRVLTARVVDLNINQAGYGGDLAVLSVRSGTGNWTAPLLRHRSYILVDLSSADLLGVTNRLANTVWDVKLDSNDHLQVGSDTLRHFTADAANRLLTARTVTMTVDQAGYAGNLSVQSVKTGSGTGWTVPLLRERSYNMADGSSADLTGTMNQFAPNNWELKIEVDDRVDLGTGMQRHFTVGGADERTLIARVLPVTVHRAGYAGDLSFISVHTGTTPSWTVNLIRERSYGMSDGSSADLAVTMNRLSTNPWDVKLDTNDHLNPGTDTLRHFTVDRPGRALTTRTLPVTIDHAGYPGSLTISSVHTGTGPSWTTLLLRERAYMLTSYTSTDLVEARNAFSTTFDMFLQPTDTLSVGSQMGQHFLAFPDERRLRAIVGGMTVTSIDVAGDYSIRDLGSGTGVGSIIGFPVIVGRRYYADPGSAPIQVPSSGPCTPSTVAVAGGTLRVECSGGGGISAPVAPTLLVASITSPTRIDLSWVDGSSDELGFRVERSVTGSADWSLVPECDLAANVTTCANQSGLQQGTTYEYRVYARGAQANAYSFPITVRFEVPEAPFLLTTPSPTLAPPVLRWVDSSIHEQGFRIERSTDGVNYATAGTVGPNVTSFADPAATGGSFQYRVVAFNVLGDSGASNSITVIVSTPAAPTNTSATLVEWLGTQGIVNVTWAYTPIASTTFIVERRVGTTGPWTPAGTAGSGNSYADTVGEGTFFYRVQAVTPAGTSTASPIASVTVAHVPTPVLTLAMTTQTRVDLSWTALTNADSAILYRSVDGQPPQELTTVPAASTSHPDSSVLANHTYTYHLVARNALGLVQSNTVSVTTAALAAPTGIYATVPTTSQITVNWSYPAGTQQGFRVQRSTTLNGTYSTIQSVGATARAHTDGSRVAGTTYHYQVRAHNTFGDGGPSTRVSVPMAIPLAPTAPVLTVVSGTRVTFSWTDNSFNENGFRVERIPAGGAFATPVNTNPNVTTITDDSVVAGTSYTYQVRAFNAFGNSALVSQSKAVAVPVAPGSLAATVTGPNQVDLTWTDAANNEDRYLVESSSDGVNFSNSWSLAAGATSFRDSTPLSGVTYHYRVLGENALGRGASATIVVPITVPVRPDTLTGIAVSTTQVNLTWTFNGATHTRFQVERATGLTGDFDPISNPVATARTFNNTTNVAANTTYRYRVRAENGVGLSEPSPELTVFTGAPAAPSGLRAEVLSGSSVRLTWTDNSAHETGYRVQRSTNGTSWTTIPPTTSPPLPPNTQAYNAAVSTNTRYYFRVYATGPTTSLDSGTSNTVETHTSVPTGAPSGLVAAAVSTTQIRLSWTESHLNETGFRIERSLSATTGFSEIATVGQNVVTFDNLYLDPGTRYYYRIRAYNGMGNSTTYSSTANAITFGNCASVPPGTPCSNGPPIPSSLTLDANGYPGTICIGSAGCVASGGTGSFPVSDGTHAITATYSFGLTDTSTQLGTLTVNRAQGVFMPNSPNVTVGAAPGSLVVNTVHVEYDPQQAAEPIGIQGLANFVLQPPRTLPTIRLIPGRRYQLWAAESFDPLRHDSRFHTTPDLIVSATTVSFASGSTAGTSFTTSPDVPRFTATPVSLALDNASPVPLRVSPSVALATATPTRVLPSRTYRLLSPSSFSIETGQAAISAVPDLNITSAGASLVPDTTAARLLATNGLRLVVPPESLVPLQYASEGYQGALAIDGVGDLTPSADGAASILLLRGRRYHLSAYHSTDVPGGMPTFGSTPAVTINEDRTLALNAEAQQTFDVAATPARLTARVRLLTVTSTNGQALTLMGIATSTPPAPLNALVLVGRRYRIDPGGVFTSVSLMPGGACATDFTPLPVGISRVECGAPPAGWEIEPSVTCVVPGTPNSQAVFGYRNRSSLNVQVTIGVNNEMSPAPQNRGQPEWFIGATTDVPVQRAAFVASFATGSELTWRVGSRLATARTQTSAGGPASPTCTPAEANGAIPRVTLPDQTVIDLPADPARAVADSIVPTNDGLSGPVAGEASGGLSVSSDGASVYTLPIWASPGMAGQTPSIAVAYSSREGNGLLGVGWRIQGIPRISVCDFSISNGDSRTQAYVYREPMFALCLDGQRLKSVLGREPRPDNMLGTIPPPREEYYLEGDPRSKVIASGFDSVGMPTTITLHDGDGNVSTFGGSQRLEGVQRSTNQVRTYAWPLTEQRDRYGNAITYRYNLNSPLQDGTAIYQVAEIAYASAGGTPTRTLTFGYQGRTDQFDSWHRGIRLLTHERLTTITASGPTPQGTRPLRIYRFGYRVAASLSGRSILESVEECDGENVCKRPTRFQYSNGQISFTRIPNALASRMHPAGRPLTGANIFDELTLQSIDLNRDGRDDILYRGNLEDNRSRQWVYHLAEEDANGVRFAPGVPMTGVPDGGFNYVNSATRRVYAGANPIELLFDRTSNWQAALGVIEADPMRIQYFAEQSGTPRGRFASVHPIIRGGAPVERYSPYAADMNGDGLTDHLEFTAAGSWNKLIASTSSAGAMTVIEEQVANVPSTGLGVVYTVDIDGDGRTEILAAKLGSSNYRTINASPVGGSASDIPSDQDTNLPVAQYHPDGHQYIFADFNGDGLQDALQHRNNRVIVPFPFEIRDRWARVLINTGGGNFQPAPNGSTSDLFGDALTWHGSTFEWAAEDVGARVVDLNQDGRAELLSVQANHIVWIDAAGAMHKQQMTAHTGLPVGWARLYQVLDFNGDGLQDVVAAGSTSMDVFLNTTPKVDLLTEVVEPTGRRTQVDYKPMVKSGAQGGVHTHLEAAVYPVKALRSGADLVSEVRRDDGTGAFDPNQHAGGWHVERHRYTGATADLRGRGWLGFSEHEITDVTRGSATRIKYDNQTRVGDLYPHAFLPKEVVTTAQIGLQRERTHVTWRTLVYRLIPEHLNDSGARPEAERFGTVNTVDAASTYDTTATDFSSPPPGTDLVASRITSRLFDGRGTLTRESVTNGEGEEITWEAKAVRDSLPRHLIGMVERAEVTSLIPGRQRSPDDTIHNNYIYDINGALWYEFTELDGGPQLTNSRQYNRDSFGRVISILEWGDAGAPLPQGANGATATASYLSRPQNRYTAIDYDGANVFPSAVRKGSPNRMLRGRLFYHEGLGVLAGREDANGVPTTYRYDGFGRFRGADRPGIANMPGRFVDLNLTYQIRSAAEGGGTVITEEDVFGHQIDTFDRIGRPVLSVQTGARRGDVHVRRRYNARGEMEAESLPEFGAPSGLEMTYAVDGLGRLTSKKEPNRPAETYNYVGRQLTVTLPRGNTRTLTSDRAGRVVQSATPNHSTSTAYGLFNRPERIVAAGMETTVQYDRLGRRRSITEPNTGTTTFVSNAFGEVVHQMDIRGHVISNLYDELGRVTESSTRDGTASIRFDSAPFGVGGIDNTVSPDGVQTQFRYDRIGRVEAEVVAIPAAGVRMETGQSYDDLGRLSAISYPTIGTRPALRVAYDYSRFNGSHLLRAREASTNRLIWRAEDRDENGIVSQEMFGNSLRVRRGSDTTTGQLLGLIAAYAGAGAIGLGYEPELTADAPPGLPAVAVPEQSLSFAYDDNHNLRWRSDARNFLSPINDEFRYDASDRLEHWLINSPAGSTHYQYRYDPRTNLERRDVVSGNGSSFVFNHEGTTAPVGPNAITSGTSGSFSYTGPGLQTGGSGRSIDYNYLNLPRQISNDNGAFDFKYDAGGTRVEKATASKRTIYGREYERRIDQSQGRTFHVFHVGAEGRRVAAVFWEERDGVVVREFSQYIHGDHQDSTEMVTTDGPTPGTGEMLGRLRFDPFGAQVVPEDPTWPAAGLAGNIRTGYTGHEHDTETGLINMRGRIYDPSTAHFLTPDPIAGLTGTADSFNRYSYVYNNPATLIDPSGFHAEGGGGGTGPAPLPPPDPQPGQPQGGPGPTKPRTDDNGWGPPPPLPNATPQGTPTPFGYGLTTGPATRTQKIKFVIGRLKVEGGGIYNNNDLWAKYLELFPGENPGLHNAKNLNLLAEWVVNIVSGWGPGSAVASGIRTYWTSAWGGTKAVLSKAWGGVRGAFSRMFVKRGFTSPYGLERTHNIYGRAAHKYVEGLAESMRTNGWVGDPIKLLEHNGSRYILDGHHRVAAAQRAGIDVFYELVDPKDLGRFHYKNVEEVLMRAAEAPPNRLR